MDRGGGCLKEFVEMGQRWLLSQNYSSRLSSSRRRKKFLVLSATEHLSTMGLTLFGKKKKKKKNSCSCPKLKCALPKLHPRQEAVLHDLHVPKSHSFFRGQFSSYSVHGRKTLKFQYLSWTVVGAHNLNRRPRKHAV